MTSLMPSEKGQQRHWESENSSNGEAFGICEFIQRKTFPSSTYCAFVEADASVHGIVTLMDNLEELFFGSYSIKYFYVQTSYFEKYT